jgi:hypothetical protein
MLAMHPADVSGLLLHVVTPSCLLTNTEEHLLTLTGLQRVQAWQYSSACVKSICKTHKQQLHNTTLGSLLVHRSALENVVVVTECLTV